jgi:hypothetical protein
MRKPRHNLKLRQDQKLRFKAPYDVYFTYLICVGLQQRPQPSNIELTPSKTWTIWISPPQYEQFILLKDASGFSTTSHAEFVDVLLDACDSLLRLQLIPSFHVFRSNQRRNSFVEFRDLLNASGMEQARPTKRTRHNFKLPIQLKSMVLEPFDKSFKEMIEFGSQLHSLPISDSKWSNVLEKCPKGSGWTLWVHDDEWNSFVALKSKLAPGLLHVEFVFLLLELQKEFACRK